jgi:hypothetical protein
MPPALSAIGPNPLMESTKTPVQNMPIVAIAVPNSPPIFSPCEFTIPDYSPKYYEAINPTEIINIGNPVDSNPTDRPAMTFVAWPVFDAKTILLTGE